MKISQNEFEALLSRAHSGLTEYMSGHVGRFYRIAMGMADSPVTIKGPTLDAGSIDAELYPFLKHCLPSTLPYSMTALSEKTRECDGDLIQCQAFNCEKDSLPVESGSIGAIIFCDVLEHLLVDPMAAVLEFNRALRNGGHLVVNTPNANSADRIRRILNGSQVATESFYKPTGIYDRHNREWNIPELLQFLELAGFSPIKVDTHPELLNEVDLKILKWARENELAHADDSLYGPELFCIAQKVKEVRESEMQTSQRWPAWLYSGYTQYHKKPEPFPIR